MCFSDFVSVFLSYFCYFVLVLIVLSCVFVTVLSLVLSFSTWLYYVCTYEYILPGNRGGPTTHTHFTQTSCWSTSDELRLQLCPEYRPKYYRHSVNWDRRGVVVKITINFEYCMDEKSDHKVEYTVI